ncbi:hypothetical protein ACKVMT_06165 [Halobacteriales archaeon Cl-PHB]
MSDYTPTWQADSGSVGQIADSDKYGSGLDFDHSQNRKTSAMDKPDRQKSALNTFHPESFGPERCPTLILTNARAGEGDQRYCEVLEDCTISGCMKHRSFTVTGSAPFPPDVPLVLSVFGTREGDTDEVPVTVESADPLTLSTDVESGTLSRLVATGCLVCGGGMK